MSTDQPAAALVAPTAADPVPDLVENVLGHSQYVSPSYWIGWVAQKATGTDPWQEVARNFTGDWEAVKKAGDALVKLSEFSVDFGGSIDDELAAMRSKWTGNAAESAADYFTTLSTAITKGGGPLGRIGEQVKTMADGMYETSKAVSGLFGMLTDTLIMAAVSASATAAGWITGIGGVIAGSATLALIARAFTIWKEIVAFHDAAWNATQATIGLIAGYAGGARAIELPALPGNAYDHRGV